jgi:hypothetical protein
MLIVIQGVLEVIIGKPLMWGPHESWQQVGDLLTGIGSFGLALGTLVGGGLAVHQYLQQRDRDIKQHDRDIEQRERQTDLELVRLQASLVDALHAHYDLLAAEKSPEAEAVRREFSEALTVYAGLTRGLLQARPDFQRVAMEAITASLDETTSILKRDREASTGGPVK